MDVDQADVRSDLLSHTNSEEIIDWDKMRTHTRAPEIDPIAFSKIDKIEQDKLEIAQQRQRIKLKLIARYNNYFEHWKDYSRLTAVLAMIGLALTIFEMERVFDHLYE